MVRCLHIVWDWNGTLLDDLEIVVESLNVGTASFGVGPIDENGYRDHFTRPVRAFYDSLFGRMVSDMEWGYLNKTFHDEYDDRVSRAPLTAGATTVLDRVWSLGWSQSLLSMSAQEQLSEAVRSRGIADYFTLIGGLTIPTGGLKSEHLEAHLGSLAVDAADVLLIGDTPDDAVAARQAGTGIILYDGGSHHLPTLEAMGAPVAHSLAQAIDLAVRAAEGENLEVML